MMNRLKNAVGLSILAAGLGWNPGAKAEPVLNFPFNEGSGSTTTDTVQGFVGVLGIAQNPEVDTVTLVANSPSGQAADRSILTAGSGFLMVADTNAVLDITEGPITLESWIFIDPLTPAKAAEGILAYGNSYKMGLRSGYQVFTLFGKVDVENTAAGPIPAGEWVHLAAAWEPGAGVHFYVNGVESFVPDANTVSRPVQHNYLSIASEGLGNNSVGTFDRMRIHHALLTAAQIDSVAATPKATLPSTLISYDFNEAALPATNSVAAGFPTVLSSTLLPSLTGPQWTNDTPSGAAGDFALAFLTENPPIKEVVTVPFGDTPIDLGVNNISYTLQTWLKLPTGPLEERRVIFRSDGPAPRVALSINANRTLHTTILGTADFTTSVRVPNDNRWHHFAAVMDNFDQLHFYLDGVLRQTVTRTQTGAPSSGTVSQLLIGKESEARYFRGVLDRVKIDNAALEGTALDYPAAPGLPRFETLDSHPADVSVEAGGTATFTATPTSATAATQQWHYRTNLADHTSVALTGETGTTLTLNNVTAAREGFYFLVVSNQAGVTESYAAELSFPVSFALPATGFEPPTYTTGPIGGQNNWTNDQNDNAARVLTATEIAGLLTAAGQTPGQTVHGGSQALLVSGAGVASTTIRRVSGLESSNTVALDVWVRPLPGAAIGNTFVTMESSTGVRAAAFRLGPANSIDYGTAVAGVWQPTGIVWEEGTWYRITLEVDYTAKTYDFLIDGVKANVDPIPFYTATSDSFSQIRIFRGANQAGMIVDDLSLNGPGGGGDGPTLQSRVQGDDIVISWPASITDYTLQATERLVPANWTTVPHAVQGAENQAVIEPTGQSRFFRLIRAN